MAGDDDDAPFEDAATEGFLARLAGTMDDVPEPALGRAAALPPMAPPARSEPATTAAGDDFLARMTGGSAPAAPASSAGGMPDGRPRGVGAFEDEGTEDFLSRLSGAGPAMTTGAAAQKSASVAKGAPSSAFAGSAATATASRASLPAEPVDAFPAPAPREPPAAPNAVASMLGKALADQRQASIDRGEASAAFKGGLGRGESAGPLGARAAEAAGGADRLPVLDAKVLDAAGLGPPPPMPFPWLYVTQEGEAYGIVPATDEPKTGVSAAAALREPDDEVELGPGQRELTQQDLARQQAILLQAQAERASQPNRGRRNLVSPHGGRSRGRKQRHRGRRMIRGFIGRLRHPHRNIPDVLLLASLLLMLVPLMAIGIEAAVEQWAAPAWNYDSMLHTVRLMGYTAVLVLALATPTAWYLGRTNLKGRRLLLLLAAVPIVLPPYLLALAYLILFEEGRAGVANRVLMDLGFGYTGWLDASSGWGFAFVLALAVQPLVAILMSQALRQVDPDLEESSLTLGIGPWRTFWRVTFQLSMYAGASGLLITFLYVISDYGAAVLLGQPTYVVTLADGLVSRQLGVDLMIQAMPLLVLALFIALLQRGFWTYEVPVAERDEQRATRHQLGIFGTLIGWGWMAFLFGISVFGPLAAFWHGAGGLPGVRDAATAVDTQVALQTSAVVAGAAASVATVIGFIIAWFMHRRRGVLSTGASGAASATSSLPGTVSAIGITGAATQLRPELARSWDAVGIAWIGALTWTAVQTIESLLKVVPQEHEDASRSLGVNLYASRMRLLVPYIWPSIALAWLFVFVAGINELAAMIWLRPLGGHTIVSLLWDQRLVSLQASAALALVLLAATIVPLILIGGLAWLESRRSRRLEEVSS